MGQEQGKTTMSEPAFAENSGQHSLSIKNRFLLYENNYLRCINNLLSEIGQENHGNFQFSEPKGPANHKHERPNFCGLPPFGNFPLYTYDNDLGKCKKYLGCWDRDNSFQTEAECSRVCANNKLERPNFCGQPPFGNNPLYTYDNDSGKCKKYLGCWDRDNSFQTEAECLRVCGLKK